jgi:hypothetical protein
MEDLMFHSLKELELQQSDYSTYITSLKEIYADMDRKYIEAAAYYIMDCTGCLDSCCLTRFYHHTIIEYLYLLEGFNSLAIDKRTEIRQRAVEVCEKTVDSEGKGTPIRIMCPLNIDGLCTIYEYRPMICRMHGIPHELRKPGCSPVKSPGCNTFLKIFEEKDYYPFDRTSFYLNMAQLEKRLRQSIGIVEKFKMTVAEMLL